MSRTAFVTAACLLLGSTFVIGGGAAAADRAQNVSVRVVRGNLVVRGPENGINELTIRPTATGLLVTPLFATRLNGSRNPLEVDGVTGGWRFHFPTGLFGRVATEHVEGLPRLAPRHILYVGGRGGRLHLTDVDVGGDIVVNFKRARSKGGYLDLLHSTVGGDLRSAWNVGQDRAVLNVEDTRIDGKVRLRMRAAPSGASDRLQCYVRRSEFGSFRIRAAGTHLKTEWDDTSVRSDARLRGDVRIEAVELHVAGDLAVLSYAGAQTMSFLDGDVTGEARFVTGIGADALLLGTSSFGSLDARLGPGRDHVATASLTLADGGRLDGGPGEDVWEVGGDEGDLPEAVRIEQLP